MIIILSNWQVFKNCRLLRHLCIYLLLNCVLILIDFWCDLLVRTIYYFNDENLGKNLQIVSLTLFSCLVLHIHLINLQMCKQKSSQKKYIRENCIQKCKKKKSRQNSCHVSYDIYNKGKYYYYSSNVNSRGSTHNFIRVDNWTIIMRNVMICGDTWMFKIVLYR